MSKLKELFGVEVGEEFYLKWNFEEFCDKTMKYHFEADDYLHRGDNSLSIINPLSILLGAFGETKIVKPILTDGEREYLMAVCNPNFMAGTIIGYFRHPNRDGKYFVEIITTCTNRDCRIYCTSDKSFEGMNEHEIYTPEKLGL